MAGPTASSSVVDLVFSAGIQRRGTISCGGDLLQAPPDMLSLVMCCLAKSSKDGLADAARLGLTCASMRRAYMNLLLENPGLSIQVAIPR